MNPADHGDASGAGGSAGATSRPPAPDGTSVLVVPAVSVFVRRGDRLLALKRSTRADAAPGVWDVVSGRVQSGEHPYDAAVRETREETGLVVTLERSPVVAYTARRLDQPMQVVGFRALSERGEVTISDEHDACAWMTIDEFARACPFPLLVDAARQAMTRGDGPATGAAGEAVARAGHVIVWEFRIRPAGVAAFESAYGPDGDWARLFRRASGYLGTELLRAPGEGRYVTVDRWTSRADFEAFRDAHRADYDALDRRCEDLTLDETPLGTFEPLGGRPAADRG
jgi:8-oxo-dGTP pyrophosphatase MutT (NUDIX family)/heme-degrading monooxygenase HmoA